MPQSDYKLINRIAQSAAAIVASCLLFGSCDKPAPIAGSIKHEYVSDNDCAECHTSQTEGWSGSHHDLAMQVANADTVLGDFNDASFEDSGVTTRFFMRDGSHFIEAEGSDGGFAEFKVAYTFGVEPLQQYLIEFPGGRLQALTVAWDTDAARWYDLYPDQKIAADDPLHWTGRLQTWNTMCAECHSTALVKGYDSSTDTFNTTWEALNVGCQACHGPGSEHIEWAQTGLETSEDMGLIKSLHRGDLGEQLNTCAPCHSRRATLTESASRGGSLLDLYAPSRVQAGLYHADGQILDEVYVYGSFMQSLMAQRGVTCTDCHDAHSLKLHLEGNAVCTQCHAPAAPLDRFATLQAKDYDTPLHHYHPQGSPGASCANCHMPNKTYMGIDERRDHSIRIPRPDLSVELGTPNACNICHTTETAEWAAEAVERWYGPRDGEQSHSERFAKASLLGPNHVERLLSLSLDHEVPSILRASALEQLAAYRLIDYSVLPTHDADASVRASAIRALANAPVEALIQIAGPALSDDTRSVRIEAARLLAPAQSAALPEETLSALKAALAEYIEAQELASDTPSGQLNLALLSLELGDDGQAETRYRKAITLDPYFLPAQFNLATLLNTQGRNGAAEEVLREAIIRSPAEGELYFSLSLLLAEEGNIAGASQELVRAAELLPERARVHYNLGLTRQHLGDRQGAEAALLRALVLEREQPDFIYALTIFYMQDENWPQAKRYAELLRDAVPDQPAPRELLEQINQSAAKAATTGD